MILASSKIILLNNLYYEDNHGELRRPLEGMKNGFVKTWKTERREKQTDQTRREAATSVGLEADSLYV